MFRSDRWAQSCSAGLPFWPVNFWAQLSLPVFAHGFLINRDPVSLPCFEGMAEQWEMFSRHDLTGSRRLAGPECSVLNIWYSSCSAAQWGGASPHQPSWVSQGTFSFSPVVWDRADSVLLVEPDGSYPQPDVLLVAFCRSYRIKHESYYWSLYNKLPYMGKVHSCLGSSFSWGSMPNVGSHFAHLPSVAETPANRVKIWSFSESAFVICRNSGWNWFSFCCRIPLRGTPSSRSIW